MNRVCPECGGHNYFKDGQKICNKCTLKRAEDEVELAIWYASYGHHPDCAMRMAQMMPCSCNKSPNSPHYIFR